MKLIHALALAALLASPLSAKSVHTKGYVKRDGTYVSPSFKTSPDSSRLNNYSTKGNYNPYSGKVGGCEPPANLCRSIRPGCP